MNSANRRPIVLLAEDSEDDAFFFRWTLQKCGLQCELIHATDGAHARRILEESVSPDGRRGPKCPDLVFLDLKMPALSGFEVLEWIREHPFDPPLDVAVLSGSEHAIDVERAKALGALAYYVKPVSPENLRARFGAWRDRHQPSLAEAPSACAPPARSA